MTKQEFEQRVSRQVTNDDFEKIQKVYTYHPGISNVDGKEQISTLYLVHGMRIIMDMYPTAVRAEDYEKQIRAHQQAIERLNKYLSDLKEGRI